MSVLKVPEAAQASLRRPSHLLLGVTHTHISSENCLASHFRNKKKLQNNRSSPLIFFPQKTQKKVPGTFYCRTPSYSLTSRKQNGFCVQCLQLFLLHLFQKCNSLGCWSFNTIFHIKIILSLHSPSSFLSLKVTLLHLPRKKNIYKQDNSTLSSQFNTTRQDSARGQSQHTLLSCLFHFYALACFSPKTWPEKSSPHLNCQKNPGFLQLMQHSLLQLQTFLGSDNYKPMAGCLIKGGMN